MKNEERRKEEKMSGAYIILGGVVLMAVIAGIFAWREDHPRQIKQSGTT